jgi:hypothetical protein
MSAFMIEIDLLEVVEEPFFLRAGFESAAEILVGQPAGGHVPIIDGLRTRVVVDGAAKELGALFDTYGKRDPTA